MIPMEGGYTPPSLADFQFDGMLGTTWFTKPMAQALIAVIIVLVLWIGASRRLKVVPGKGQFFMEMLYDFIRNGVGRDNLGPGFRPYIGLLLGLFTYLLLNNWFGEFFLFMFPTFANIGYSWGAVALVLVVYLGVGFKTHGIKYLKNSLVPEGVPWYLIPLIAPIEALSVFITRPLTLGIRIFAVMFAGHMAIMVFVVGGEFLLTYANNVLFNVSGVFAIILGLLMMALELFLGFLQAYIFTILTAQYISSSLSEAH